MAIYKRGVLHPRLVFARVEILITFWFLWHNHFYFTSSQPIRPKEASDSDFTIEDVMLWPGMRFSLRSQCKRCSAGRLHKSSRVFRGFEQLSSLF